MNKRTKQILSFFAIVILGTTLFLVAHPLKAPRTTTSPLPQKKALQEKARVVNNGPRDKKEIALTFDADMTPGMLKELKAGKVKSWYNEKVIDTLRITKTPATLFLTGMWVEEYPDVAKQLSKDPLFEIGNHSYSHPSFWGWCYGLRRIKDIDIDGEIGKAQTAIESATGSEPKLFRFPGGCYSSDDLNVAGKYGLTVIGWDVVSGDAFEKDPQVIVNQVLKRTKNGSIVVFHMHGGTTAPATGDALPTIISALKSKGFKFVKVSQMLF